MRSAGVSMAASLAGQTSARASIADMPDKDAPTQQTPAGATIPVPTREDVMHDLRRVARADDEDRERRRGHGQDDRDPSEGDAG